MFVNHHPLVASTTVSLALALASAPSLAGDPVRESFDRMLTPHAANAAPHVAATGTADPLIAALVVPLRDGVWPSAHIDPVAESFARMLNHEPSRLAPPIPAGSGVDPLIAAMVWPLLREQQMTVAALRQQPHL